ncbi:MAG TPA: hypothetical protein PKA64_12795 [Myxococcota bacterium]|nr:hypothetical protein [Myxococcota bacterium]
MAGTQEEEEGAGFAFRAEMWLTDFVLRFWRAGVALVIVVLVGAAGYGEYTNWIQQGQRNTSAAVADAMSDLSDGVQMMSFIKSGRLPDKHLDVAGLTETANKLVAIGRGASGAARVEACVKAAELFRLADDAAGRRTALELAASEAKGPLLYAVSSSLADLDIDEGKAEQGLARLRELQRGEDTSARLATLDLAAALEGLDRKAEAVQEYDTYLERWKTAPDVEDVKQRRDRIAGQGG